MRTQFITFGLGLGLSFAALAQSSLPTPRSDADPLPPTPRLEAPSTGVTEQAGVGGSQAYGRVGVMELGGNFGFTSGSNLTQFDIGPSIGYFFMDNWEISGIANWTYSKVEGAQAANIAMLLAEPSFHIFFNNTTSTFLGMGVGVATHTGAGDQFGLALAPRVGLNVLVGRSGIFKPFVRLSYATNDVVQTDQGTLLGVSTAVTVGAGYSVLW